MGAATTHTRPVPQRWAERLSDQGCIDLSSDHRSVWSSSACCCCHCVPPPPLLCRLLVVAKAYACAPQRRYGGAGHEEHNLGDLHSEPLRFSCC